MSNPAPHAAENTTPKPAGHSPREAAPVPLFPLSLVGVAIIGLALVVGGLLLFAASAFHDALSPFRDARRPAATLLDAPDPP